MMSSTNLMLGNHWGDEWPEYVEVQKIRAEDSETIISRRLDARAYFPVRTCHVVTSSRRVSQTQTYVTKSCSRCGHAFWYEEHREMPFPGVLGDVEIPNYCPNCGALVFGRDE